MRQSKRTLILEAGSRVVQRDGVTALTYESVAQEAGVTKGGLLYHFPSRDALLLALHEHVAGRWEAAMEADAGGPAGEVDAESRFLAYARLHDTPARAELLLMLEASEDEAAGAVWDAVHHRWAPPVPERGASRAGADDAEVRAFLARLAADGFWLYEALEGQGLDEGLRERLLREMLRMTSGD
ncbi:TetR/AcrR family transcriptional regulator [Nesterenkonia cremea]|uniref:Transcriptional regulator n=1 Tax=Nesterenkonia cremea TaxID=1882340 RepID=A0A917AW98_9MICC|nr:TetR family transcriptional regulator [Nesterenkonia cremea]GGE75217.1 transcriptional regulator [Nesterenkonia cremea]